MHVPREVVFDDKGMLLIRADASDTFVRAFVLRGAGQRAETAEVERMTALRVRFVAFKSHERQRADVNGLPLTIRLRHAERDGEFR